jgi:hypothetical protein
MTQDRQRVLQVPPAEVRELKKYNDDLLVSHPSNPLLKLVLTSLSIAREDNRASTHSRQNV